jgi:methylglutamate dehydrogenase subunit B
MLVIACPHCGQRDVAEFTYGGDASRPRPDTTATVDDATWDAYLYLRDDPAGPHDEFWHHVLGCRQWLTVTRDTVTDQVIQVRSPPSATGGPGGASR